MCSLYIHIRVIHNETRESNEKLCNMVILLLIHQSLETGTLGHLMRSEALSRQTVQYISSRRLGMNMGEGSK